ncbi:amidohydrolase [uncultured Alsobacter sp.]|uniref:amidohydrolase family protein n=1 Tax=uncultured Alsobacter sp. TaxID=1748258 RepID=UPI0025E6BA1F|nr:amidohydrolase [uncultured Alsobacter sp.]
MSTVFTNAFIYAGGPAHRCIPDGAIVIDAGRIAWMGPAASRAPQAGEVVRDLGGKVVMPGMINTHAHGGLSLHRGCGDEGDLFEWAASLAPFTSTMTDEDNLLSTWMAVMEMVAHGITAACDCARYGAGLFSQVASTVGMRSVSGALANSPELRPNGKPNWPSALEETKDAMAARAGDGLSRFFLGAHSPYNCTPALLVEVKQAADDLGLPFAIHAAESRKEVQIVLERHGRRPIEHLHALGVLGEGAILAHCVWVQPHEIAMLAEAGAGVAHNPVSNGKLASGIAPIRDLRAAGVPVGLGTDSTLSNNSLNLFQEMKVAVLLQRTASLDGFALKATDALAMGTHEGARVLGWDDEIGTLEPGKAADFVVLDIDHPLGLTPGRVMSDIVYAAGPQHVREVVIAGRTVFRDGRFTQFDQDEIRARIKTRYGRN